ncbi:MAG: glycosyl transferase [Acidobacteriota bacterium]
MSDFFQNGTITTLHRLGASNVEKLEEELFEISKKRKISLVLPALFSELKGRALPRIIKELQKVKYLYQIVITLGRTEKKEFKIAKDFFSALLQKVSIIWNDGERIQKLYKLLEKNELSAGPDGKGRSTWMAYGYVLADGESDVIALHDCDILTYNRELLARLIYPVANPNLNYEFSKGYYSRITDRLHGRVTRLFFTPFIRALRKIIGPNQFLEYLDSFRYPLAGEFSMIADLIRNIRIPGDWGLEAGVLAEVYANCSIHRICQSDLTDNYEHKHQPLLPKDPQKGLLKMVIDISKSLFRTLARDGIVFSDGFFKTLGATYSNIAMETILRYENDAAINSLVFDRHYEALAVETFIEGLRIAGEEFIKYPYSFPYIPRWRRISSAIPNFFEMILNAVKEDNK